MPRLAGLLATVLGVTCVTLSAHAAKKPDPDKLPSMKVQDLHYGDVLFNFYAGDEFEALTRLEAYDHWQRMPHHETDAALLAGGLYLTLGLHEAAGKKFESLLTPSVPVGVRNRAWFYLAKIWYARGYYDRAEQALGRISGAMTPEIDAERTHLLINVLMKQERFDEAAAKLAGWQGPPDWMAYAQLNLGIARVRQNRTAEADAILTAVGTLETSDRELRALRDKANLALGYAWLQAKDPAKARIALNRVRLSGPYATRALLGVGWADSALGDFQGALTPWMALHDRNLLDAAVQESFLAVPYAFGQLGARGQAADNYESAIKSFGEESARIDEAMTRMADGHLMDDLLGDEKKGQMGWFWQLRKLPDAPQSRYLYSILADNDFQEGLKNYRDLAFLDTTISRWQDNMDAFSAMIDLRQKAYAERLPRADALIASNPPSQLLARRAQLDSALTAAETGNDFAALAPAKKRDQWARIRALENALASAAGQGQPVDEQARDKLRLIKGVLYWQLDAGFKARVYEQKRAMRALDAELNEAQNRWVLVQRARKEVPTNTSEFAARIAALQARMNGLGDALKSAQSSQEHLLVRLAEDELGAQKGRLAAYEVQARYALADIYDRAAAQEDKTPAKDGKAQAAEDAATPPANAPAESGGDAPADTGADAPANTGGDAPADTGGDSSGAASGDVPAEPAPEAPAAPAGTGS